MEPAVHLASRNLKNVTVLPVAGLNTYDVLKHKHVAITQAAIAPIMARLGRAAGGE